MRRFLIKHPLNMQNNWRGKIWAGHSSQVGLEGLDSLYLTAKFKLGEQTGKKTDPAAVARSMTCAKNSNGGRLLTSEDYLVKSKIASYFSRLASKKSLAEDEQQADIEVAVYEQATVRLCQRGECQKRAMIVVKPVPV